MELILCFVPAPIKINPFFFHSGDESDLFQAPHSLTHGNSIHLNKSPSRHHHLLPYRTSIPSPPSLHFFLMKRTPLKLKVSTHCTLISIKPCSLNDIMLTTRVIFSFFIYTHRRNRKKNDVVVTS